MIYTLNPHISALNETSSALKFALRGKMIRYKAVVNKDSSVAEYWKQKYLGALNMLQDVSHIQKNQVEQSTPSEIAKSSSNTMDCEQEKAKQSKIRKL